jgi:LEA14-like dessication related protein
MIVLRDVFRRPLVVVLALLSVGCVPLGRQAFRNPTVELRDIRVRALGLEGGSLDLVLDVYNPNDFRMDATRLTYTLSADSGAVASGAVTKRVTLMNKAHNDVSLPVSFSMKELMGAAQILLRKGSVDYTVKGNVTVDTPFGSFTRPYEGKARLDNASLIPR